MTRIENQHYEMVPSDRSIDSWDIRILEGEFNDLLLHLEQFGLMVKKTE